MCGIAGAHLGNGGDVDAAALDRMTRSLRHRGPDEQGTWARGPLGLGATRLRVVDPSPRGRQPMRSEDGRFTLVYNGEIYNFQRLRRALETRGHRFRGRSDTEVVLRSCIEWGVAGLRKFEGMFALALWDDRERRLLLARDPFGIKPLYYHHDAAAGLVFGSEIKALLASGQVSPRVDWAGLQEYLHFGTTLGVTTVFDGVRRLAPGHLLTASRDGVQVEPYASVLNVEAVRDDLPTAVSTVRARLDEAVRAHLASDVPPAVFLSGGVDSSAVTAFASRHHAGRLATFAVGFDAGVSELPAARRVAEHFRTDHHELHVSGRDAAPEIERLVRSHDAPFADAAGLPLQLLSAALGDGHAVVLTGDGGDEVFGGYATYLAGRFDRPLRLASRLAGWAEPVERLAPGKTGRWRRRLRALRKVDAADAAEILPLLATTNGAGHGAVRAFTPSARPLLQAADPLRRYREVYRRIGRLDPVQRMLHADCSIKLPDQMLEKTDRATMAHGVEARLPLLDARLTAYAMGLPSEYKVRGWRRKHVFRRALRGVVPDFVLNRPKRGFTAPMDHWLRTSLAGYVQSVLLDGRTAGAGLLDAPAVERIVREHLDGRENHGVLLYRLLNLNLWHHAYRPAA